jgi:hypothetical protein
MSTTLYAIQFLMLINEIHRLSLGLGKSWEIQRLAFKICLFVIKVSGTLTKKFFKRRDQGMYKMVHTHITQLHIIYYSLIYTGLFYKDMGVRLFLAFFLGREVCFTTNLNMLPKMLRSYTRHPQYTSNNFPFMYSQKRFSQTSLQMSAKYF